MDLDALIMLSVHSLDKIVTSGEFTVTHGGAIAYTGGGVANYPGVRVVEHRIPHDYGRAMLIRGIFSLDNGASWQNIDNVYAIGVEFQYRENNVPVPAGNFAEGGVRMQVAAGCDANNLHFRLLSNYMTPTSLVFNLSLSTFIGTVSGWSAVSQNVRVKYWAFERA